MSSGPKVINGSEQAFLLSFFLIDEGIFLEEEGFIENSTSDESEESERKLISKESKFSTTIF